MTSIQVTDATRGPMKIKHQNVQSIDVVSVTKREVYIGQMFPWHGTLADSYLLDSLLG